MAHRFYCIHGSCHCGLGLGPKMDSRYSTARRAFFILMKAHASATMKLDYLSRNSFSKGNAHSVIPGNAPKMLLSANTLRRVLTGAAVFFTARARFGARTRRATGFRAGNAFFFFGGMQRR